MQFSIHFANRLKNTLNEYCCTRELSWSQIRFSSTEQSQVYLVTHKQNQTQHLTSVASIKWPVFFYESNVNVRAPFYGINSITGKFSSDKLKFLSCIISSNFAHRPKRQSKSKSFKFLYVTRGAKGLRFLEPSNLKEAEEVLTAGGCRLTVYWQINLLFISHDIWELKLSRTQRRRDAMVYHRFRHFTRLYTWRQLLTQMNKLMLSTR